MTMKNLLVEFEKDDTLEPNMSLFMDSKNKLTHGISATTGQTTALEPTQISRPRIGSDNPIGHKEPQR